MPELPEVSAIATFLDSRITGLPIRRVDVAGLSVLKTADPPYTALAGRYVSGVGRMGKYLVIGTVPEPGSDGPLSQLDLVIHLSRAGWVRWSENLSPRPPKPGGKGPIALRVHCGIPGAGGLPGEGFDVTDASTQKRVAAWICPAATELPEIARLGPDALVVGPDDFATILAATSSRLKTVLTDQRTLAGIGNAYSDEILHAAGLSPFASAQKLGDAQVAALFGAMRSVLTEAGQRLDGQGVGKLKGEKRTGLRVHGRAGLPCPVCGDTVREVSYADRSFQYCPACQTGGKVLADRRLSRLLK